MSTDTLVLKGVEHRFGAQQVLTGMNLTVQQGEIICLLGASGSGKSTALRLIAGLEPLQEGAVYFAGELIAQPGRELEPQARQFGLVFQDHVLFPHLSVANNVGYGLTSLSAEQRASRVQQQLQQVGLGDFAERYPHTLSGGQQQRVALARALANEPRLMLFDEPFASVDANLRRRLREQTRLILKASQVPAIVVTHDAEEAMELADRIAVMHDGRIVQCDTPANVWAQPANRFVAELFTGTDAIQGRKEAHQVATAFGTIPVAATDAIAPGTQCQVIIRPRSVRIQPSAHSSVRVADVRALGDYFLVLLTTDDEILRVETASPPGMSAGDRVDVLFAPDSALMYNRE